MYDILEVLVEDPDNLLVLSIIFMLSGILLYLSSIRKNRARKIKFNEK